MKYKKIKNYYENVYEEKTEDAFPFDEKRILSILKNIPNANKNDEILDIGCGVGYSSDILSKRGYKIAGIDISEKALALSKKRLPNGEFKIAREDGILEFEDNRFSFIICLGVLEHVQALEQLLNECYRVLKPGGKAIFLNANSWNPYFWFSFGTGQIYEKPRSIFSWTKLLENANFEIISYDKDPGPTILPEFSLIKKFKIILHRILNVLPKMFTYQINIFVKKNSSV